MHQHQQPPVIVTDSNVSLPQDLITGLPLIIVPLEIHHGGRVFQDGVDISSKAFYDLQANSSELPKTSAPQPGAFLDAFRKAADTSTHVLCLTLAGHLSSTYESADAARREAAAVLPNLGITLVDSRSAGTAQGLIALSAARKAASGSGLKEVMAEVEPRIVDTCLFGYLETLYYVWRGGRVPRILMWMGNLLQMKPILQLADGKVGMVERPRTGKKAMDRLVALATQQLDGKPGRVAVMHADAPDQATELAERLQQALQPVELFVTEFTPVIGAHTGPGLVGCALHPIGP